MLPRVLEPEVMDTEDEARNYDAMDHSTVNQLFAADFLSACPDPRLVVDVGTGTAQIPIELCCRHTEVQVVAVDLAEHMLSLARENVAKAGLAHRIRIEKVDAKQFSYADATFPAVMSNSIIHHIPEPFACFAEMYRICRPGGVLFVRDLSRPQDEPTLQRLVNTYAAGANEHQRKMFADSLHAALTLDEVRELVGRFGYEPNTVQATSDRHWTWIAIRE